MDHYHGKYGDYDPATDPWAAQRAASAHDAEIQTWFAPHVRSLNRLSPEDSAAIFGWQLRALDSGTKAFGIQCPTGLVVMAAAEHLSVDESLSQSYCAIREGLRQRNALHRVAAHVAMDDTVWDALMAPIEHSDISGKAVIDAALLILLDQHYGKAVDAFWQVATTWHEAMMGHPPALSRATFDACLAG